MATLSSTKSQQPAAAAGGATSRLRNVHRIQTGMAAAYAGLGSWCLLHPPSVLSLSLTPAYRFWSAAGQQPASAASLDVVSLFVRCFGAQAMTVGLVLGTSTMTPFSFRAFGWAMVPYLTWNVWFGAGPASGMLTRWMALDFVCNVFFCLGSFWCAKVLEEHEQEQKDR